ncbi:histidine phosphatase family protein [Lentisphaerota bacterium ZTH]|nr:histidine phosphatase family protein [Lentisphaerota bacterium]WET05516.1 histidine phosphatase family protein [Lentisphaerota bacterium ZTH]
MKNLIIIRHSKTEKYGKSDFERKLTERGRTDAATVGKLLKKNGVKPEMLLCSPAKRARKTAKILTGSADWPQDIIAEDMILYTEGACEIISQLRSFDDSLRTLVIVGHNPVLLEIVNILSKTGISGLRTSGVVKMRFKAAAWSDISEDTCCCLKELN